MRRIFSLLCAAFLVLAAALPPATATAATPPDRLLAAKNAYLDYTTTQLQTAANRLLQNLQQDLKTTTFTHSSQISGNFTEECFTEAPATIETNEDAAAAENNETATDAACAADGKKRYSASWQGSLSGAWNVPELVALPASTPALEALQKVRFQLGTKFDGRLTAASSGERLKLSGELQLFLQDGVLTVGLPTFAATDLDQRLDWLLESDSFQALQAKKWLKVDLNEKLTDWLEGETLGDIFTNQTLITLTEDGLNSLIKDYIDQVWRANPIFTPVNFGETTAELQFGPDDLHRLLNAHIDFVTQNPTLSQFLPAETGTREYSLAVREMRRTVWQDSREFAPLTLTANFVGDGIESLRFLKTWKMPETNGFDCPADGGCKPLTIDRNFHADVRYYFNGSLNPADAAVDALFATRIINETAPTQLNFKLFPAANGTRDFRLNGTALDYSNISGQEPKLDNRLEVNLNGQLDVQKAVLRQLNWTVKIRDGRTPDANLYSGVDLWPPFLLTGSWEAADQKITWLNTLTSLPTEQLKLKLDVTKTPTERTLHFAGENQIAELSLPLTFRWDAKTNISQSAPAWEFAKFATEIATATDWDAAVRAVTEISAGTLKLGTPATGKLTVGKTDVWTFAGTAGQKVTLKLPNVTGSGMSLTLESADFENLQTVYAGWNYDTDKAIDPEIKTFELPTTGTYRVLVETWDTENLNYTLNSLVE